MKLLLSYALLVSGWIGWPLNLEIGWRGNILMIMVGFKLVLSENNLML